MHESNDRLTRAAYDKLVRQHHAAVYASALRIVRDVDSALDVTQNVYVALLEGRITLSGTEDERVLRWFAIRGSLQILREQSHRRQREETYAMEQPEARLDARALDADSATALERFIERLPDELRAAVHLRFHEGLTFARIGEALEISEPAAFERVKRALERLKDGLSRAGLSAVALDVEHLLETSTVAPTAPIFVAQKLASLHPATASASIAAALLGTMLLVVTIVIAGPRLFAGRSEEARVAVAYDPTVVPVQVTPPATLESLVSVATRAPVA